MPKSKRSKKESIDPCSGIDKRTTKYRECRELESQVRKEKPELFDDCGCEERKQKMNDAVPGLKLGDKTEKVLNSKYVAPITNFVKDILWSKDTPFDVKSEVWKKVSKTMGMRINHNILTKEEYMWLKSFQERRTLNIVSSSGSVDHQDLKQIANIYSRVFKKQKLNFCTGCQGQAKLKIRVISELDKLIEEYEKELKEIH